MTEGPFLLDAMVGKLAVYLRMCGHDTAYVLDRGVEADEAVLGLADAEGRTLLTRDAELAGRAEPAVLLRSRDVAEQLRELERAGLALSLADPPTRCGRCNGRLEPVPADAPTPDYAPDAGEVAVWRCGDCGQHFWRGSHWADVRDRLATL